MRLALSGLVLAPWSLRAPTPRNPTWARAQSLPNCRGHNFAQLSQPIAAPELWRQLPVVVTNHVGAPKAANQKSGAKYNSDYIDQ